MFLVWFTFIIAIAVPFGLKLADLPRDVANPIMYLVGAVALAIIVVSVGWRLLAGRTGDRQLRTPDPRGVLRLKWPRDLTHPEMDAFCTAYLRAQGWAVAQVVSNEADGEFLEAKRQGAHLLILCDVSKEVLRPAQVRSVALAASAIPGARAAVLRQSREAFPKNTQAAAREIGALLLHVPDLASLSDLAAADAVPDAARKAEPAVPAAATSPRR